MKLRKVMLIICAAMLCFGCIFVDYMTQNKSALIINEVCSKNDFGHADDYGRCYDWIELYNTSNETISLKGYCLTDSKSNMGKYEFKDETLGANEYIVIFFSEDLAEGDRTERHANFQLSAEGESVYLVDEFNQIVDFVEVPELTEGTAYAREKDGGEIWQKQKPSPQRSNDNIRQVSAPEISVPSGFYNEKFEITMSVKNDNTIYYTLDGSIPDETSFVYDGSPISIGNAEERESLYSVRTDTSPWFLVNEAEDYVPGRVDKANIVRAIAYDEYGNTSEVITASYFVGFEDKKEYENVSVLSLVAEPDDLFGYYQGIYTMGREYDKFTDYESDNLWSWRHGNYSLRGKRSERKVHIDFFNEEKERVFLTETIPFR